MTDNVSSPLPHQLPHDTVLQNRYRLIRVLGEGGFGITYEGWDETLRMRVAVKEFFPRAFVTRHRRESNDVTIPEGEAATAFEKGKAAFLNEARTLAQFQQNPNIVSVTNFFEENQTAYIVMEFLDGRDLKDILEQRGTIPFAEAFALLEPVMQALSVLHAHGLIHRDISPSNIMVLPDGTAKLLDFGASKVIDTATEASRSICLKPGYSPEEQYRSRGELGPWTDVYALSATMYHMLVGFPPDDSLQRILLDEVKKPSELGADIPAYAEAALMRGLAVQSKDRYQSIQEMAEAMRACPEQKKSAPIDTLQKSRKTEKKSGIGTGTIILLLIILFLVTAIVFMQRNSCNSKQEARTASANSGTSEEPMTEPTEEPTTEPIEEPMTEPIEEPTAEPEPIEAPTPEVWYPEVSHEEETYFEALSLHAEGEYWQAISLFVKLGDYADSHQYLIQCWNKIAVRETIAAGNLFTVGLQTDGTVVAIGYNQYGQCDVSDWRNIVAISAGEGHTVGLKADGTVVAVGMNEQGQCDVSDWRDIVAISAGAYHTVGLKADGTTVAVGCKNGVHGGRCDVSDWNGIIAISAGVWHTVGLKADGTVVAVGDNEYGQCDVSDWKDIIAISSRGWHTVGLKTDGTVVAVGRNDEGQTCVSDWTDITAISTGDLHTVGLKADGTVIAVGDEKDGNCDVSDWRDITAISAGGITVGYIADGTVIAVGGYNTFGERDVSVWRNIRLPTN